MFPACLALLLLSAAAAAADAAHGSLSLTPLFTDWMSEQLATRASTLSYDAVETESVCLQQTKFRNCRNLNNENEEDKRKYYESTLACCDDDVPGAFMTEKQAMAVCNYLEDVFGADSAVEYDGVKIKKVGVFTATCELRHDSDRCGSPVCEGMSIKVEGDIMSYDKVAFIGTSALGEFPTDESCAADDDRHHHGKMQATAAAAAAAGTEVKTQAQAKHAYKKSSPAAPTTQHFLSPGLIYSGPFHVVSRAHPTKYDTGRFQYVRPSGDHDSFTTPVTLPERAYVAKAYQVQLQFIKSSEH